MNIVITVHGVESLGEWQKKVHCEFTGVEGLYHYPHTFGPFDRLDALSEDQRLWAENEFLDTYSRVRERHPGIAPSIIAHSFGTYIVGRALMRFPFLEFDRVILCGSILDPAYDWGSRRVNRVRNEVAGDDEVVRYFRHSFVRHRLPGSGPSGVDGFLSEDQKLQQVRFDSYLHSDYFITNEHCRESWMPFICGTEDFRQLCRACWRKLTDVEAQQQFDRLYGGAINDWMERCGVMPADPMRPVLDRIIRRQVMRIGMDGKHRPDGLIAIVVVETVGEWRALLRRPR